MLLARATGISTPSPADSLAVLARPSHVVEPRLTVRSPWLGVRHRIQLLQLHPTTFWWCSCTVQQTTPACRFLLHRSPPICGDTMAFDERSHT